MGVSSTPMSLTAVEMRDEIEDTLRVAAMVQDFRRDGHLTATLDPLRRAAHGPWLAEVPAHVSNFRSFSSP